MSTGAYPFEISFTRGRSLPLMARHLVNPRQIIASLYIVLFVGIGVGATVLFADAWGEYKQLKAVETASRQRLAIEVARLKAQEIILERLRTDPEFVEKTLRARWGFVKSGEVIYRFPE
ncbi:MAG: septum formation initiator family protein [Opitutaceae bacterium]|nr:septum formation initiator family protein [Opitutaceae bacterium]